MTLIGDVQRVAALLYVSMQRDTNTALGHRIGRAVFAHLDDRKLIYRPAGWPVGEYLVTMAGRRELERLLGGNEVKSPASLDEYNRRFMANTEVTGYGIEGVTQHMPCPFCAAKDWLVVRVLDFQQDHEATCGECGRTAKLTYSEDANTKTISVTQTGGPDQPEWLKPPMPDARHA